MYCLNMLKLSIVLAKYRPAYEDICTKFLEHFIAISRSIAHMGKNRTGLWDPEDGFFYDALKLPDESTVKLKVRSFVGLIPLFGVEVVGQKTMDRLPKFKARLDWFVKYRPKWIAEVAHFMPNESGKRILSLVSREQLVRVLSKMLDQSEFLSDFGLRSLSKFHQHTPYVFKDDNGNVIASISYQPAESQR
jgi:hypothetical protein